MVPRMYVLIDADDFDVRFFVGHLSAVTAEKCKKQVVNQLDVF